MEHTYLCKCHAQWVADNPVDAFAQLSTQDLQATIFSANMQFDDAIRCYGCGFDIVSILLASDRFPSLLLHNKLATYCLSLSEIFDLQNQPFLKRQIIKRAYEKIFTPLNASDHQLAEDNMLVSLRAISKTLPTPLTLASRKFSSAHSH